jgi:hypothetical protein
MASRRWMVAVAVAACLLGGIVWHFRFPRRAFDAAAWNEPAQINGGVCQLMADRLIARDCLRGMTRAEVVRLLGEPLHAAALAACPQLWMPWNYRDALA